MLQIKIKKQSGFIVLMGMLALVIGAGIWFGTLGSLRSNTMQIANKDKHINELHLIKDRMLAYAALHPEIYDDAANVPGPGYFPCPDIDGDGVSDTNCDVNAGTNRLFVLGKVPFKIAVRFFTFVDDSLTDNGNYWYAIDARFVNSSARYATGTWARFSNLNNTMPNDVNDSGGTLVPPFTVDGKANIVMALFYAGEPIKGQSRPSASASDYLEQPTVVDGSTINFRSVGANSDVFNDYVLTITRKEWEAAVLSRVTQGPDMCLTPKTGVNWFNDCTYTGTNVPSFACTNGTFDNLPGQGWRTIINCPP